MPGRATRVTQFLDRSGIPYRVHRYQVAEQVGAGYGESVAAAIGLDPARVLKTLVAEADDRLVVAVVPVSWRLSTRRLAEAAGARRCRLADGTVAERATGYLIGGISPFGQRKSLPFFVDRTVMDQPSVAVSGGRRGLQLELSPADLVGATGAVVAELTER